MMSHVTEIVKLRRKVLTELSRLAFAGKLGNEIDKVLNTVVTEEGPRYRCCVYKERAVLKERIKVALSQPFNIDLATAAKRAINQEISDEVPLIQVMSIACDQCPIDKFFISNACRNCLAHNCISDCPKDAIMVVQNRAYIDKNKCVECGMCKKSCPYGAVIEVSRPCESACGLGAIKAGSDRRAVIDYDKCVECGGCKVACPFGAIVDQSFVIQIIAALKSGKRVHALIAPAFIGQFGVKTAPEQVFSALRRIGFATVSEVTLGADITTYEETKEFMDKVPDKQKFLTTSCCPSFVNMVEKHVPKAQDKISSTVSPMIAAGRAVKAADPESITVFIGPCIAKKGEAKRWSGAIDYVATFEEIACMLIGADINLDDVATDNNEFQQIGSVTASQFAYSGGVAGSVAKELEYQGFPVGVKVHKSSGLKQCRAALLMLEAGRIDSNFFEGMACEGGCIAGPGVLANPKVTGKLVENYAAKAKYEAAGANDKMIETVEKYHNWHNER